MGKSRGEWKQERDLGNRRKTGEEGRNSRRRELEETGERKPGETEGKS